MSVLLLIGIYCCFYVINYLYQSVVYIKKPIMFYMGLKFGVSVLGSGLWIEDAREQCADENIKA
jgi:hypothetical protein